MEKEEFKRRKAEELKPKWTGKAMHGQFVREMPEKVDRARSWEWMSRSDLKVGTEALQCAAPPLKSATVPSRSSRSS